MEEETKGELGHGGFVGDGFVLCDATLAQFERNYVLCQVMYKGDDADISYGNNLSEPSQSLVSVSNTARAMYTITEVEQLGGKKFFGMSVNDLINPVNEQEDLSLWDAVFNPNTLLGLGS